MDILSFHPDHADFSLNLARCADFLASGGVVAIPTDTVYGLGGDATNSDAVARIFELKSRPQFNPLIAHVCDLNMAQNIGIFDETSLKLAECFWPGPLTIVVGKKPHSKIHDLVCAGLDTIAIRCPGGAAGELIKTFGKPLAAPSANRSGRVSSTSAAHVATEFCDEDLIILDGGACKVGIESTIAKVTDNQITVLRVGSICADALQDCTAKPVQSVAANSAISAPGMMASHYAPRARVKLNCRKAPQNATVLSFGSSGPSGQLNLSEAGDMREAASNLYHHIKELDKSGTSTIHVAPIPFEGLGIAINDRLMRAAAPRPAESKVTR